MDLKCLDQACPYKLHTLKCTRKEKTASPGAGGQTLQGQVGEQHKGRATMQNQASYGRSSRYLDRQGGYHGPGGHNDHAHGVSHQQGQPSRSDTHHSQAVWISGYPGNNSQEGCQGMTVQHLLEAQIRTFQQELARQREEVRKVQQQLRQQLLPYPVQESRAWDPRLLF